MVVRARRVNNERTNERTMTNMLGSLRRAASAARVARTVRMSRCGRTYQSPGRPILHRRIEEAAREGDLHKVRAILKEAEAEGFTPTLSAPATSFRHVVLSGVASYAAYNSAAAMYDYRVTSRAVADAVLVHEEVECSLLLEAFSTRGRLSVSAGDAPATERSVRVLPHVYVSDLLYGSRSRWRLNVEKKPGQTRWWTSDEDGDSSSEAGGSSSVSSEWSTSSSGRRGGGSV